MKAKNILTILMFFYLFQLNGQTVETNAEIQIGQSVNPSFAGAIRWTGNDFEGFNGTEWISFTQSNANSNTNSTFGNSQLWGQPILSSLENYAFYAPDDNQWDHFGISIDVDDNIAVVGGYLNDVNGVNSGSAYVFEKTNGIWTFQAKLLPSDSYAYQAFGNSVAISGDVIIVGAKADQSNTGAVYVFEKPATGWVDTTETAKLTSSDGVSGDIFGHAIAIENSDIVVGSHSKDLAWVDMGAVYIYTRPDGGWVNTTENAKITASDSYYQDAFGISVDISNGTIVVGAVGKDIGGVDAGAIYIFEKPSSGWIDTTETIKLLANTPSNFDYLGSSVSIDTSVIASGARNQNSSTGAVYLFEKDSSGWNNTVEIFAHDGQSSEQFGFSVDIKDNVLVVGCPYQSGNVSETGALYIIRPINGKWENKLATIKLLGYGLAQNSNLGYDVVINDDEILSSAIYAIGQNSAGVNVQSGKILVYQKN